MKIILIQKKSHARTIEENTISIFPDNETNRQRYGHFDKPSRNGSYSNLPKK